jgi:hypothetical protein
MPMNKNHARSNLVGGALALALGLPKTMGG